MKCTQPSPGPFRFFRTLATLLLLTSALGSTNALADDKPDDKPADKKAATGKLVILPGEFTLQGSETFQRLLPGLVRDGRFTGTPTGKLEWSSSNPKVVTISDQTARPVGNGQATITVRHKTLSATAQVTVTDFERPVAWDFRIHVQAVLTKSGCNGGACHGALAGKNGFKLSLRGYDPIADVRTITRQNRGRRVIPNDPGRSLLLTKPTGAVPHKGGVRFEEDSREYRVVSEWIAAGHPAPRDDGPRISRLEILPHDAVLQPGSSQQLVVRAHFSDGHSEDVTRWAKFTSNNTTVAEVDDTGGSGPDGHTTQVGTVSVIGHGETAIVAWYLSRNVVASLSVPYANSVISDTFDKAPRSNFIDDVVLDKLKGLSLPPSPRTGDSEFLRRATLDALGVLPTPAAARAFLEDTATDRRVRLIERLLARPEYVDYWTHKWSDLLLVSSSTLKPTSMKSYSKWIRDHVSANTPWNEFARDLVTARGTTHTNGAANFFVLHRDPADMAETVSMAFLGMSIQCAKCHDHPLEKWTNDEFYGMANLFSRVRFKTAPEGGDGNQSIFTTTSGELIQPRTGKPQLPKPLDGQTIPFNAQGDRRNHLANWLVSPENPYFTRAIVNRVWANFLGTGIVENVDDLRLTNPPSNEQLLSKLSQFLVQNRYDLKALIRLIMNSQTYQRTSRITAGNEADRRFYARYYPRRLKAEVLLDAISAATGQPTTFKDYPAGTRSLQLPDSNIASRFLSTFGRPDRVITCECERSDEPSMVQVLHIVNGNTLNDKLQSKTNRIGRWLSSGMPDYRIVESIYLASLSRYPTNREMSETLKIFAATPEKQRRELVEDVLWSVISTREFLFNH